MIDNLGNENVFKSPSWRAFSYVTNNHVDFNSLYDDLLKLKDKTDMNAPVLLPDLMKMGSMNVQSKLDKFIIDNCFTSYDVKDEIDLHYRKLHQFDNLSNRKRDIVYNKMQLNPENQIYTTDDLLPDKHAIGNLVYEDTTFIPIEYRDLRTMVDNFDVSLSDEFEYDDDEYDNDDEVEDVVEEQVDKQQPTVTLTLKDKADILKRMDHSSSAYRICLGRYMDEVKALDPQARVPENTKLMSGTDMQLYVFDAKPMPVGKSGVVHDSVLMQVRQRRDVDPTAHYAGAFVTSKDIGSGKPSHWQPVDLTTWNQIADFNDYAPLDSDDLKHARDNHEHLINRNDNLAFAGNIFVDSHAKQPNGRFTYLINPKPDKIKASPYYFDIRYEQLLDRAKRRQTYRDNDLDDSHHDYHFDDARDYEK